MIVTRGIYAPGSRPWTLKPTEENKPTPSRRAHSKQTAVEGWPPTGIAKGHISPVVSGRRQKESHGFLFVAGSG